MISLPYGKHEGKPITEVPYGYLRWLIEKKEFEGELKTAIHARLCGYLLPGNENEPPSVSSEVRMPFGKYYGVAVSSLPVWYLRWLANNVVLYADLDSAVRTRLASEAECLV